MRILITGASGYVGGHCWRYFSALEHDILATTRYPKEGAVAIGELTADTDWRELLIGVDVVIHTAAIVHQAQKSVTEYHRVNVDALENLAIQASDSGVKHFIFLSSAAVYGDYRGVPFTEQDTPSPQTAYGLSKWQGEQKLQNLATSMKRTILRCPMIYGPAAPGNYRQLERLLSLHLPLPFKAVSNQRSFLGVRSLLVLLSNLLVLQHESPCLLLNATERPRSTLELIEAISQSTGKRLRTFRAPAFVTDTIRSFDVVERLYQKLYGDYLLSDTELLKLLGPDSTVDMSLNFNDL